MLSSHYQRINNIVSHITMCWVVMIVNHFIVVRGDELQIGFRDVALLFSRACFYATFIKNCSRSESLWTTACLGIMVGGK